MSKNDQPPKELLWLIPNPLDFALYDPSIFTLLWLFFFFPRSSGVSFKLHRTLERVLIRVSSYSGHFLSCADFLGMSFWYASSFPRIFRTPQVGRYVTGAAEYANPRNIFFFWSLAPLCEFENLRCSGANQHRCCRPRLCRSNLPVLVDPLDASTCFGLFVSDNRAYFDSAFCVLSRIFILARLLILPVRIHFWFFCAPFYKIIKKKWDVSPWSDARRVPNVICPG